MSTLCPACEGITLEALVQPDGYEHLQSAVDLVDSAKTCDFCRLIRHAMDQNAGLSKTDDSIRKHTGREPLYLYGEGDWPDAGMDSGQDKDETRESPRLFGINVHIPDSEYGYDLVKLSLFVEPGPAAGQNGSVAGRRLLNEASSVEGLRLVQSWYTNCRRDHQECNDSLTELATFSRSTRSSVLPTRVLDIGTSDGLGEPYLWVGNGARGDYAALSHCWGKHRILTTTNANLIDHCKVIPLARLPKTFQDAILVAKSLSLRYIWIDSICIVQDDPDDWRKESLKMGQVYTGADITIAATRAMDGSEGCFIPRSNSFPVVGLPRASGTEDGSIYATLFPDMESSSLKESALGRRAWITQEWMLSRRVTHYTKTRMIWACRELAKCEDGENEVPADEQRLRSDASNEDILGFYEDWCDLVPTYSGRSLTYESDKPIAILGLATEVGKTIGEAYSHGVFHDDFMLFEEHRAHYIMMQLLWFAKSTLTRPPCLRHQPYWSWTSTIGAVSFLAPARTAHNLVHNLSLRRVEDEKLSWTFDAPLKKWEARQPDDPSTRTGDDWYFMEFVPKSSVMYGGFASRNIRPFASRDMSPGGWAAFDARAWPDEPFYLAALSANVLEGQPDGFNIMVLREEGPRSKTGGVRSFVRLGVGQVVDQTWFDGVGVQTIRLI